MPLILGCFALVMPRVVLTLVWVFSNNFIERNFADSSILWPIAGLIFAPLTTLAYAYAHEQSGGHLQGVWLALVIVAALLDLGLLGSSRRKRRDKS